MNDHRPTVCAPRRKPCPTTRPVLFIAVILILLINARDSCAQRTRYDIWKGNRIVGSVLAGRTITDDRTRYLMTAYAEMNLVAKLVYRTTVAAAYHHGNLSTCYTQQYVNDDLRDSSRYQASEGTATCYVHPGEHFAHGATVTWSTARLYFDEPVGQRSIFVESVLKDCPLKDLGGGRYQLTLPGGKVNTYHYDHGVLERIEVKHGFIDLVFKRDG